MHCSKVKSVRPLLWSRFRGFSYLFDNPGRNLVVEDGVPFIHCDLSDLKNLELYAALAGFTEHCAGELAGFQFCKLPPESYHVTVMDGLNDANLGQLAQPARGEAEAFLTGLPASAVAPLPEWFPPRTMSLEDPWIVRLRLRKLHIWRAAQALVALLDPADPESEWALERIRAARRAHEQPMVAHGKPPNALYQPHLSAGYFATSEMAGAAQERLAEWNRRLMERARDLTIQFASISCYSFTDMTRFWLQRPPAMMVERHLIEAAVAAGVGYLGSHGDQKLALSHHWPVNERLAGVRWTPLARNGKRHCLIGPGLEAAVFDQRAEQDLHCHRSATEVYTVLHGRMQVEIEGTEYLLDQGDTVVVCPGAAHRVQPGGSFLARVVTAGCQGKADRFPVDSLAGGGCTPAHALVVRAGALRTAIAAGKGRLAATGSQKILVVGQPGPGEIAPPPEVEWNPGTAAEERPVQVMPSIEMAAFDHRAEQDRHCHGLATEIYWVIDGAMEIEIDGEGYRLSAGDMAIVCPRAAHEVKRWGAFLAQVLTLDGSGVSDKHPADFSRFDSVVERHSGFWKRPIAVVNTDLEEKQRAEERHRPGVTLAIGAPLPAAVLARVAEAQRILDGMLAPHLKLFWRPSPEAFHITVYGVVKPAGYSAACWPLPAATLEGIRRSLHAGMPLRFRLQGFGITGDGSVCVRVSGSEALERIRGGIEKMQPAVSRRGKGEDFAYIVVGRVEPGVTEEDRRLLRRCLKAFDHFAIGELTAESVKVIHYRNEFLSEVSDEQLL